MDAGTFPESSEAAVAAGRIAGPYKWPSWRVRSFGVLTNRFGAGAYRGPTAPQTAFALESLLDDVAAHLNMESDRPSATKRSGRGGSTYLKASPGPRLGSPRPFRRSVLTPCGIGATGSRPQRGDRCRRSGCSQVVEDRCGSRMSYGRGRHVCRVRGRRRHDRNVIIVCVDCGRGPRSPVDRVKVVVPDTDSAPPCDRQRREHSYLFRGPRR